MGSAGLFGIGLSGLSAAQAGLATTGHNIANVNTPGYSRQQTIQSARAPQFTGSGYFGQGVNVDTVRRVYSDFLASQVRYTQATAADLATRKSELDQLDNMFASSSSSLGPALGDFFAGVNTVAANPADMPSRQTMLSSARTLVSRFNQMGEQLSEARTSVNAQIDTAVGSINAFARDIGSLNRRIAEASAVAGDVGPPNDLLDQRDALLVELNKLVGATAVPQSDGSLNVFLANGQSLVVGQDVNELMTGRSVGNPEELIVGLKTAGGLVPFRTQDVSGGALGALLGYRDGALTAAQNALGRIATATAQAFNDQHRLGQDLAGQPGGAFFSIPAPRTVTVVGTATISASLDDAGALTTSDYQLAYDGTNYRLTKLDDNTTRVFATLPQTVDGLTFAVASGAPAAGDLFLIEPTRAMASDLALTLTDPAKIAAAAPIRTGAATANSGTGTISAGSIDASYLPTPLVAAVDFTFATPPNTFTTTVAVNVTVGTTTTAYAAGAPIPYVDGARVAFNGLSFTLNGAPAAGDKFTVQPNIGGTGDSRNAVLLAGLSTQNLVGNGTNTLHGAYAQIVAGIGNATREAGIESDAQALLLTQVQSSQSNVSGVNLDEEAANLQRYQQAYQAAGKFVAIAGTLFQTLISIISG
jgi:flagellar hook-associated protein 1 FlgK